MLLQTTVRGRKFEYEGLNLLRNLLQWTLRRERWGASLYLDLGPLLNLWADNRPDRKPLRYLDKETGFDGVTWSFGLGKWRGCFQILPPNLKKKPQAEPEGVVETPEEIAA